MRSNSGSGKSNNNLRDPTMKEHEESRRKLGSPSAHGRAETAADAKVGQRQQTDTRSID